MKTLNDLSCITKKISLHKLKILSNNNPNLTLTIKKIQSQYEMLEKSFNQIYEKILKISDEIELYHLQNASSNIVFCRYEINNWKKIYDVLLKHYINLTQCCDVSIEIWQNYIDIYEKLHYFYTNKIVLTNKFQKINESFDELEKEIYLMLDINNKFDSNMVITQYTNVNSKFSILSNNIFEILKFQIVDSYFNISIKNNKQLIKSSFDLINKNEKKQIIEYIKAYEISYINFLKSFNKFDLVMSNIHMIKTIEQLNKINNFCSTNVKMRNIINICLNNIRIQTIKISEEKNNFINCLTSIQSYFKKSGEVITILNSIKQSMNNIVNLNNMASNIKYETNQQEIFAIDKLMDISKSIYKEKLIISNSINKINDILDKNISSIYELNNLNLFFYQLMSKTIYLPSNSETENIKNKIEKNLEIINQFLIKQSSDDITNNDEAFTIIQNLIYDCRQIYKKININYILKNYSINLTMYANRYKNNLNLNEFDYAKKLYNAKKYDKCIDQLLNICSRNK